MNTDHPISGSHMYPFTRTLNTILYEKNQPCFKKGEIRQMCCIKKHGSIVFLDGVFE